MARRTYSIDSVMAGRVIRGYRYGITATRIPFDPQIPTDAKILAVTDNNLALIGHEAIICLREAASNQPGTNPTVGVADCVACATKWFMRHGLTMNEAAGIVAKLDDARRETTILNNHASRN